mgnify:CR=1 FL=1
MTTLAELKALRAAHMENPDLHSRRYAFTNALYDNAPALITIAEAAQLVLDVSDQFVEDTGLKHGDPLTDAVNKLRKSLKELK